MGCHSTFNFFLACITSHVELPTIATISGKALVSKPPFSNPSLKLFRNEISKRMTAAYHEMELYFSVHKRKNKSGEYQYVYIVSNMDLCAKNYLKLHEKRWVIEKIFRTIKQLLGLNQCYSRFLEKQETHIYFFSLIIVFWKVKKINITFQIQRLLRCFSGS